MREDLAQQWGLPALAQQLQPLCPDLALEVRDRVGSTNEALLERCRKALAHPGGMIDGVPMLLVAQAQTHGRGRQGRPWWSRPGDSLTFSLALRWQREGMAGLSLAVGVALAEALDARRPGAPDALSIGLKWPNDLMLAPFQPTGTAPWPARKLGGVLIETVSLGAERACVVGVGLNVRAAPTADDGMPDVRGACLRELDVAATPPIALARVAPALWQALALFQAQGFAAFADRYARRDLLAGRDVLAHTREPLQGRALGISATGALRVQDAGGRIHEIAAGEVSVRVADGQMAEGVVSC